MDERLQRVVNALAALPEIEVVAMSGEGFPKAGESDVDLYVYSARIPDGKARGEALSVLNDLAEKTVIELFSSPVWGVGDMLTIDGVEVCLMHFTTQEERDGALRVLRGEEMEKQGQFYPTGRLASLLDQKPLLERTPFLRNLQAEVRAYPPELSRKLTQRFLGALDDRESFERAVFRKDPLFFHQALEYGLDDLLQGLFALNRVYFPSRKRTLQYVETFALKPEKCGERLLEIVRLGANGDTLAQAYRLWDELAEETKKLAEASEIT